MWVHLVGGAFHSPSVSMWYMCCQHIVKCETSIAYRIRVFTFKHFARGIAMLMDEPNQNWTSMRIEMWTLSKSKRKCGAIIFALVWISKVVFTQLCANVVFCVLQVFGIIWCRSSKNAATILFVCFFLLLSSFDCEVSVCSMNWIEK